MAGAIPITTDASGSAEGSAAHTTRSLLVVDCGSVYTKAALLGLVEQQYRLLAVAQAPTTRTPPIADIFDGIRRAIADLEHVTGRTLTRDGQIVVPETDDGSGVDAMAMSTSAAGPLRLLATGPGRDALAGLLHRAVGGLFVHIAALPTIHALDAAGGDTEWQDALAQVRALDPHALLVVGSPFGGGRGGPSMEETAGWLVRWLDALHAAPADEQVAPRRSFPVLFAGSAADADTLTRALQGHSGTVQAMDGLSPSTLAPLNRAVSALYEASVLRSLPGYRSARGRLATSPIASVTATAGMVRYLAQQYRTSVVGVDVGASSTALAGATARGEFLPAVHPSAGVGPGIGTILRARGMQQVMQWLSVPATEDEVREYALMRMLRPYALPATARELEFEHAFAREAIQLALHAPGARLAGMHPMDVVLGTGGVLANVPQPALAALVLLDGLQPRGVTSLLLDTAQIASMLGSAAGVDAVAAGEVAERDAVAEQLGTVISIAGGVAPGQAAVRVTLDFSDGRKHVQDVLQGALVRLPLARGEQAILGLYPAPEADVGLGAGQHARASEPVEGGALGLIIDARGRPLSVPADTGQRIAVQAEWRRALGLEA